MAILQFKELTSVISGLPISKLDKELTNRISGLPMSKAIQCQNNFDKEMSILNKNHYIYSKNYLKLYKKMQLLRSH